MTHHMALHNDVLGSIHIILKQDNYFRTLEYLPVIDGLHAYDDIQLFPELFDMPAVIERITSEADLIEKQLNRTHSHKHLCHVLQVLFLDQVQHSELLHLLHHHLQQEQPSHIRHRRARNLPQAVHYHVDREHLLLHQPCSHQYSQMVAPLVRVYLPTIHQCTHSLHPRVQHHKHHPLNNNYLLEHKIIHYLRIPFQLLRPQCPTLQKRKYQNHSMEKESRITENKPQCPQLIPKIVNSAFRCKQLGHLKKDCPSYPTVLNVELEVTSHLSFLQNNRTTDGRMKDAKGLMKDAKLGERIGRSHRTDHSSPTRPTNALTVQAIMELRIVQQNVNHMHPR